MKIFIPIFFILLVSCSSEKENQLIHACSDNFYSKGIFDKRTGEPLTPKSDSNIHMQVIGACRVKVELYLEGYRVNPLLEKKDLEIYLFKDSNGLKTFHKKLLECKVNPDMCK